MKADKSMRQIIDKAIELGISYSAVIDVEQIAFDKVFHDICAKNTCRQYGSNHMCPPLIGNSKDCIDKVKSYKKGLVIQRVFTIEDSFDYEGMMEGQRQFDKIINALKTFCDEGTMILGAGACSVCEKCTALIGKPCGNPKRAVSSMEAHCIDVNKTLTAAGLKYNNGEVTVSFTGLVLF